MIENAIVSGDRSVRIGQVLQPLQRHLTVCGMRDHIRELGGPTGAAALGNLPRCLKQLAAHFLDCAMRLGLGCINSRRSRLRFHALKERA